MICFICSKLWFFTLWKEKNVFTGFWKLYFTQFSKWDKTSIKKNIIQAESFDEKLQSHFCQILDLIMHWMTSELKVRGHKCVGSQLTDYTISWSDRLMKSINWNDTSLPFLRSYFISTCRSTCWASLNLFINVAPIYFFFAVNVGNLFYLIIFHSYTSPLKLKVMN